MNLYRNCFKRIFDFVLNNNTTNSLSSNIIIHIDFFFQPGIKNIFFQKRHGKSSVIFNLIKFKTMFDLYDKNGDLLPDEKRITKIGKFLRITSLGELPQLFNVLKGEMSLIGRGCYCQNT